MPVHNLVPFEKDRKSELVAWLPYTLREKNKKNYKSKWKSILSRQINDSFLKKMSLLWQCSTGKAVDWQGRIPAAFPKAELHGRKVMLSVPWKHYGFIHFEFLNSNQTLNAVLYSQQLQRVHKNSLCKRSVFVNRKNDVPLDNAGPHSARISRWEKYWI